MNPIDRLDVLTCLKKAIDDEYKKAKLAAEDCFFECEQQGIKSLGSTLFGEAGGEYKRGKTKTKTVVIYEMTDWDAFDRWLYENVDAMHRYCYKKCEEFAKDLVEQHGELPDGIERIERKEPPTATAPKLYRFDHEGVLSVLMAHGGLLEGANRLLLEGGDGE